MAAASDFLRLVGNWVFLEVKYIARYEYLHRVEELCSGSRSLYLLVNVFLDYMFWLLKC